MNDESGPKAAPEAVSPTGPNSTPNFGPLDGCTGLDDPRFRAAELLADAWGSALAAADRLGYSAGWDAGWRAAEADMERSWSALASKVSKTLSYPTYAELQARRGGAA